MSSPDLILHRGLFTTLDRSNPAASAVAIPSIPPKKIATIKLITILGLDAPLGAVAVLSCTTLVCCVRLSKLLCAKR